MIPRGLRSLIVAILLLGGIFALTTSASAWSWCASAYPHGCFTNTQCANNGWGSVCKNGQCTECWSDSDCGGYPQGVCQNRQCKCGSDIAGVPICGDRCPDRGLCYSGQCTGVSVPVSDCRGIERGNQGGVISYCDQAVACSPSQGTGCQSAPNSCGMRNSGTIQCNGSCSASAPPNSACGVLPIGSHDVADCTWTAGWAFDPDYAGSTAVHIYANGPAGGGGTFMASVSASGSRPDVGAVYPGHTNSGWSWTIPATLKDGVAHALYAYAINVTSSGTANGVNPLLPTSPKTITCANPPTGTLTTATCGSATGSATDPQGSPVTVAIYDGLAGSGGTQIGSGTANSGYTIPFPPFTNGQTHSINAYGRDIPSGTYYQLTGTIPVSCAPTVTLNANPTTVAYGGTSALTWSVSNAVSCSASPAGWFNASSLVNGVANGSGNSGPLVNTTDFKLTCTNAAGQAVTTTATVGVNIPPPTGTIVNITDTDYCTGGAGMNITWGGESPARPIGKYQVQVLDGSGTVVFDSGQQIYSQAPNSSAVATSAAAPRHGLSRIFGQLVAALSSFIR